MEETSCHWVCSRGILKSCRHRNQCPRSSDLHIDSNLLDGLEDYATVHICSWLTILRFVREFVPKLTKKVIMVTNDSDMDGPINPHSHELPKAEIRAFLDSDLCVHWFTQNCTLEHPKVTAMPIGMDYHTLSHKENPVEQERMINEVAKAARPSHERSLLCYGNFKFGMNDKYYTHERRNCFDQVPTHLCRHETSIIPRKQTWEHQSHHAFVLSPAGGGLDCHRTWEALILGCIPILRKLSPHFEKIFEDLPVLLVDNWTDITEELLQQTIDDFKTRTFRLEKLTLSYWIQQFNKYKK